MQNTGLNAFSRLVALAFLLLVLPAFTSLPLKNEAKTAHFYQAEKPDVMPSFPGGQAKLDKYIQQNLQYPEQARANFVTGTVQTRFVVEKDGSLSNIQVVDSLGSGCDEEAIRLITTMPKWNAARKKGKPVRTMVQLAVNFGVASKLEVKKKGRK